MYVIYAIVLFIVIYALLKERASLGGSVTNLGEDCDNEKGKAIHGTTPELSDSPSVLLDKIRLGSQYARRMVYWRRAVILAFAIVVLYMWFLHKRVPTEYELALGMVICFSVIYFSFNFYQYHSAALMERNLTKCAQMLSESFLS